MGNVGRPKKDGIKKTYFLEREVVEQSETFAEKHNMTMTGLIEKALAAVLMVKNPAWLNIQQGFLTVLGDMDNVKAEELLGTLSEVGQTQKK